MAFSEFNDAIAALCFEYLNQANDLTPSEEEFVSWVDSQPLPVRPLLYMNGPVACWQTGSASFKAWVLAQRGYDFNDYMVQRLSEKNYLRWVDRYATTTLS